MTEVLPNRRKTLLWLAGVSLFVFGLCELELTVIQPLGPCLRSNFQLVALFLGIASFCIGTASLVAWAVWSIVEIVRRRKSEKKTLSTRILDIG